jgi:anti-anti-sigma factor
MKLTFEQREQITVFSLRGEINEEHVDGFRAACRERMAHHARDFVLDLDGVESIDSQGLEAMLWLQEQAGDQLGQVRLVGLSDDLAKVLEITRLAPLFQCYADVDAAVKSLQV